MAESGHTACNLVLDRVASVREVSGGCLDLFGRPARSLLGWPFSRFLEKDQVRPFLVHLWTCRNSDGILPVRLRLNRSRVPEVLAFCRAHAETAGQGFDLVLFPLDAALTTRLEHEFGAGGRGLEMDALPLALLVAGPRRILRRANRLAMDLFRLPGGETSGRSLARLLPNVSWSSPAEGSWTATAAHSWDGKVFPVEFLVQTVRDEKWIWARDLTETHRSRSSFLDLSEQERRRIGRELHDSLGQHLTGLTMLAGTLAERAHGADPGLAEDAERVAALARQVVQYTRNLSRGLFPPDLEERDLAAALQDFAAATRDTHGVDCRVQLLHRAGAHLPDELAATHLFRIAQEAVTNSIRHGQAKEIQLVLELQDPDGFRLEVADDGQGFPPGRRHAGTGLRSMRNRAELLGAALEIQPMSPRGVSVRCWRAPSRATAAART